MSLYLHDERGGRAGPEMLDEESITHALSGTIAHLEQGNLDHADASLHMLGFEPAIVKPVEDRSNERQFIDPAAYFGVQRRA